MSILPVLISPHVDFHCIFSPCSVDEGELESDDELESDWVVFSCLLVFNYNRARQKEYPGNIFPHFPIKTLLCLRFISHLLVFLQIVSVEVSNREI